MHSKRNYNAVWRIVTSTNVANERFGEPVRVTEPIKIEHCATSHCLSNDFITYKNDFGDELEVSALNAATKLKAQILASEFTGTKVRENTSKHTYD